VVTSWGQRGNNTGHHRGWEGDRMRFDVKIRVQLTLLGIRQDTASEMGSRSYENRQRRSHERASQGWEISLSVRSRENQCCVSIPYQRRPFNRFADTRHVHNASMCQCSRKNPFVYVFGRSGLFSSQRPYFWNSQSLLSRGHTWRVFNQREMQWKWKAC
jgi:hypothetical protein